MKPHKHAELIKAWADGAEIQIFNPDTVEWEGLQCTPVWNDQMKYRIKPSTHPVKELTNDAMRAVINEIVDGVTVAEMVTFLAISRAILRKAQEK